MAQRVIGYSDVDRAFTDGCPGACDEGHVTGNRPGALNKIVSQSAGSREKCTSPVWEWEENHNRAARHV